MGYPTLGEIEPLGHNLMMVFALFTTLWLAMSTELDTLVTDLQSQEADVRATAAEQLCRMGEAARGAALPLVTASGDDQEQVRDWATAALEEMGPPRTSDALRLADLLADKNPDRGYWAATLLGRLKEDAAAMAESLGKTVAEHPVPEVRQRAAWALGKIGPSASTALEALEKATESNDPRLVRLATRAIDQIQP